jgi:5-methylcytosine-specific restriction protein A
VVSLKDIGREQVLAAIAEYDRLGQDEFLTKYGFKPARDYVLVYDGKSYDSKAIVGVAHGYLPGEQPLKASEFSGGNATVGRLLRDLGFVVSVGSCLTGEGFAELLTKLNVNRPGGVPALYQPITLLWAFGRARSGEPRLVPWQHTERALHDLFTRYGRPGEEKGRAAYPASALYGAGLWDIYAGAVPVPRSHGSVTESWFRDRQPMSGLALPVYELLRTSVAARIAAVAALVGTFFTDVPFVELLEEVGLSDAGIAAGIGAPEEPVLPTSPAEEAYRTHYELYELAKRGLQGRDGQRVERTVLKSVRSAAARKAVLARSGGQCENPSCGIRLQDVTDVGDPILEIDHVWDLALGGPDDPAQMIALCPNCHAIKTRGRTRESLREVLLEVARDRHEAMLRH